MSKRTINIMIKEGFPPLGIEGCFHFRKMFNLIEDIYRITWQISYLMIRYGKRFRTCIFPAVTTHLNSMTIQ